MTAEETQYYNALKANRNLNDYVWDKLFDIINGHTIDKPNVALQLVGGVPMVINSFTDNNIFAGLYPQGLTAPSFNEDGFQGIATNKSFEERSGFKNSPFGQYWEKNLPNWALPHYGAAKVISVSNIKIVDITQTISQAEVEEYNKLFGSKINPYKYTIYVSENGETVLRDYNNPKIKPADNEVIVFMELDDGKFDFGKVVRVKLGLNVVKDLKDKLFEIDLDSDELATEIIRKIKLSKNKKIITDINNSDDVNSLLINAIDFEYGNKKFDDMSIFFLFLNGLDYLKFKSTDWIAGISHWIREKKYEDEKYWNGHLIKDYEPAFLPTSLFNKTKEEKAKIINGVVNKPLLFIDDFIDSKLKEHPVLSKLFQPKLLGLRTYLERKLKPFGVKMIDTIEVVEDIEVFIQYLNAIWVGIWNGILEFIAGLVDLVGLVILIIKQELGFRITDQLWEKIENLFNFVYYKTQSFFNSILNKIVQLAIKVINIDLNGYKVAKEIGELIPDILTILVAWLKASKVAKAGSIAAATEEVVTKDALQKLEKEGIEEIEEKAVKEAEKKLENALLKLLKVVYGESELSKIAIKFRKTLPIPTHGGNIAIFEYLDDAGKIKRKEFTTLIDLDDHAEVIGMKWLRENKIPNEKVIKIYSELEPCSLTESMCKQKLQQFKNASIEYSYDYPGDNTFGVQVRQASRLEREKDLKKLLK